MTTEPASVSTGPDQARYEFTPTENQVFADLAKKMRLVGNMQMIFGLIGLITGGLLITRNGFGGFIQGVVLIFLGQWSVQASGSFQRIVDTEGQDMGNLMEALTKLNQYFGPQYILIMVALGLLTLALALVVFPFLIGSGAHLIK